MRTGNFIVTERTIKLMNESIRDNAVKQVQNLPCDGSIEICIRPVTKTRSESQNKRHWAAVMKDISDQAYVGGKQFSVEIWHSFLKAKFLPSPECEDIALLVKNPEKYQLFADMPDGSVKCVGSTTQLTVRGFSEYMESVQAWAVTECGVMFSAKGD